VFDADAASGLVLFRGKEPNLNWEDYADCVLALASEFGAGRLYFIGSYAGVVPHTRDPRLHCSVSEPSMKAELEPHGVRFSNYQGPAGISTYLTHLAPARGLRLATLVAEIPAYIQGENPRCIEAMTRRLAAILGLRIDLEGLRAASDTFEARITEAVRERPELAERVRKMEADYDSELFDTQMGDLKQWLEQQGISLE
jgi:proteasome assembly chaperone (PAC2) family protein